MSVPIQRNADTLFKSQCFLGESPFWHSRRNSFFWVDIEKGRLYEMNWENGSAEIWELNRRVSFIVEHKNGHVLLGMQGGIVAFDPDNGNITPIADVEPYNADYRCNDGFCDAKGRIWHGVMHMKAQPDAGTLNCLFPDGRLQQMITGLTIPNGIAWSRDGETMYFIDSTAQDVKAYTFDEALNQLVFKKVIISIPKEQGTPDGLTIDSEGMLWIALYGGFSIIRCNPVEGTITETIKLPVPNVTNCCFAGPALDALVITTAQENMSEEDLAKYPESGDVFIVRNVGATGLGNNKADL